VECDVSRNICDDEMDCHWYLGEVLSRICIRNLSTGLGRVESVISLREVCSLVKMDYPTLA
jgi:hypothetical protein